MVSVTTSARSSPAPFKHGERVRLAGPDGEQYVVRVESITPRASDLFALVAAVVEPRNLRNRLISTPVDSFGATLRVLDTRLSPPVAR